ncbi:hypothetical protein LQW54_000217 [Pestalotiopsis sp. IQ-011]
MFLGTENNDYLFTTTYAHHDFGVSDWIAAAGSSSEQTQATPIVPAALPTHPDPFQLDLSARDHLLAFAVDACEPETLAAVVSALPTCEGLETLARAFMGWHAEQEDTFVHAPTFVAAQVRMELLMAVVAGGAVRSASPAVQRFGFALHRVLGTQLARLRSWRKPVGELQLLQAYALYNHIGLWSSNKRTIEMAQGGNGSLLSVSSYFYVFVHSNQESIMTSGTTPLSYFELTLPLPVTRKVWSAPSDAAWAEEVALSTHGNSPQYASLSITDCLANLSRLSRLSIAYDQTLSRLLLLCALAPMIQSYRHLHMAPTWGGEDDAPASRRRRGSDRAPGGAGVVRAGPTLGRSHMARRSAWYAGQVLGKLRDLDPAAMTEFHCMIIYQALLCLWAYGAIAGSDTELDTVHDAFVSAAEEVEVALDSTESSVTKKCIIFGRGCPVISAMRDIAEPETNSVIGLLCRSPRRTSV